MLEIEIKAALKKITKDTVIDALHAAGFEEGRLKRESDLYFNGNILEELRIPKENLLQESYLEMLMNKKQGSDPE